MQEEQPGAAKGQLVALMQAGHHWHEAAAMAGVHIGRSAAYQLLRNVRLRGEVALQDGRHGHPAKLRPQVREFLETMCREAPYIPSHVLQAALQERFGLMVSIGHLNRVRDELGVGSPTPHRGKNCHFPPRQRNRIFKKGRGDYCTGYLDHPFKTGPSRRRNTSLPCLQTQSGQCRIRRRQ
jgi:transposase